MLNRKYQIYIGIFIFYNKIFSVNNYAFFITLFKRAAYLIVFSFFFVSCYNTKNIAYFQDLQDTSKIYSQVLKDSFATQIQPDDIINITVNSINSQAAAPFNMGNNTPAMASVPQISQSPLTGTILNPNAEEARAPFKGYLVDKDGMIDFPVLGQWKVSGLTTGQLRDQLREKLNEYLQNPTVNVRIVNFKITVLGEVSRPSTYSVPGERITVMDALGMAGDLTIYGQRENVLLIREENGERKFIRMNLNSSKVFESPYLYLKQNDIVYVQPNKSKVAASDMSTVRTVSYISAGVTLLVLILTRFK